ncbi:MAG TPA: toxin [Stenotrophomonas sp.]|nr:toxin [Stenotrophomonas sp.]
MASKDGALPAELHQHYFWEKIVPESGLSAQASQTSPKAIILAGQPGAGKGNLKDLSREELHWNVIAIDPDDLRQAHPDFVRQRQIHPYTWSEHTHNDAKKWAQELRSLAIRGNKNIILDSTLGNSESAVQLIKELQSQNYDVEVRGVVAHRLESELGVDRRFTTQLDDEGFGRYVPESVRRDVYEALPGNLDKVQAETGVRIRLYGREGTQVYDNHTDARQPGAALEAERESRLKDPRTTQTLRDSWRAQGRWHDELAETLPRNSKVSPTTATAVLDERASLNVIGGVARNIHEANTTDHTVRVRPNMVRGAVIGGTAATIVEAATEGTKIADLYARDNRTGAEAALLDFGARSVGGWTGAALGAKAGTLVGIESGPGAIVTGIIGAGLGAWGASEVVEWIEKNRINNQTDSTGKVWSFDPEHPENGWTHRHREIVGTVGTLADRPLYGPETVLTADPALTQQLNYQASSLAVGLRMRQPDQPINPFSIAGDVTDTPSALPRSWERNPENGEWRREVVHQVLEHGIKSTSLEVADAAKAAQLDDTARGVMALNAARSPAAFAKQYEQAYVAQGWSQHGPIPDEVVWARDHPDHVLASDGRTYQRQADGEWLHDGWIYDSLAEGNIRAELNGTYPQIRTIQQMEAPIPGAHERRIEALTINERDAYQQAIQEANRLGVAAPQAQQLATAAVAEARGEHIAERLTPQAVIDAHTEAPRSAAASAMPRQEQRAPEPSATTPPDRADPPQEPPHRDAPSQEATKVTPPQESQSAERHETLAETRLPERHSEEPPAPLPGTALHEGSDGLARDTALRVPEAQGPAPTQDAAVTHTYSPAALISSNVDDAEPVRANIHEVDATQAPIQTESDNSLIAVQVEPVNPPQAETPTLHFAEKETLQTPQSAQAPEIPQSSPLSTQKSEARPTALLPTQPEHPDHELYLQVREGIAALDAKHGRTFDAVSERMTASLLVLAKDNDLERVDHVLLSNATADKPAGHTLFVVQGDPSDPAHQRAATPTELAAQTSVEDSMQQFDAVSREAHQRALANQLEQQLEDQRVQQDIQARAASMG